MTNSSGIAKLATGAHARGGWTQPHALLRALLVAVAASLVGCTDVPASASPAGRTPAKPRPAEPVAAAAEAPPGTRTREGAPAPSSRPAAAPASGGAALAAAPRAAAEATLAAAAGAASARAAAPDTSFRHPATSRLVAIGDVHGDLAATRAALRLGGAIDADDHWIGGDLTVVQTGDQLDRGDDERQIVDLFSRLAKEAPKSGGRVIPLNGNHETMNVQGDFRYVTPAGLSAFAGVMPRSPHARGAPPPYDARAAALLPGGRYALELAERDVVAVVGDSVFVHGGVLPEHVAYGLGRINRETRAWMRSGERAAPASIASPRAPVWVRDYSLDPVSAATCAMLGEVLASLRVRRMVVGHTTQMRGITSACNDRVYRIDVGLSRYYGGNQIQVLEIKGNKVRILSAPR